ncbi:DUF4003 family protein [Haloimpatiens sp. FM7330]|uniref:DUF4003 family protein n=1 Tax=Haloimpatiens sp. FM7330 TaxID=3298610 RepID=UPI0036301451
MELLLKQKVDLMVENYYKIKRDFKWDYTIVKHFMAMNLASQNKSVNTEEIQEIKNHIKKEVGLFSRFKGINLLILSSLLCLENNYKDFFKNMQMVYEKMKDAGFTSSEYLPLASYTIVKQVSIDKWDEKIERMKSFYSNMKKNHFWLTSTDDYVLAAVLATSDLDVEKSSEEIEKCYKLLNQRAFTKGNSIQSLSQILAFGEEDVENKCSRAIFLYDKLKSEKCKLKYSGLTSLGVLTLIACDENKLVEEIKEVYDYIRGKSGYGMFSIEKSHVVMLSSSLVADSYIERIQKGLINVTLANSINAIVIAQQQAAIVAACAASSAAASSASS